MDRYNVTWNTPSKDSSGSMPIGNGDIGLNVWVEEGGDLLFYLGKTDAWNENGRLLKLGRVRVSLSPNPFKRGLSFLQTLKLRQGEIEIVAGQKSSPVTLRLWVDAHHPVVRVEAESARKFDLAVSLELWRTEERRLTGKELFSAYGLANSPHPVIETPDTILPAQDRIVWFHRNRTSIWRETLALQGMEGWCAHATDPLLNRTFGGLIQGSRLVSRSQTTLVSSEPYVRHRFVVCLLTNQSDAQYRWFREIEKVASLVESAGWETAQAAHRQWWEEFWERSWLRVSGSKDAETVSQGYLLQRFINACAGRGAYPIKFNGSIFTVECREEEEGQQYDADYRRWGGPYWFQNTRLVYWPMLASGDFDLVRPLFAMFLHAMPFSAERTKVYFGHEGIFFPETMYFWGAYANDNYGWNREGKPVSHVENTYIRWYWSGGLELLALMLDYYAYTGDKTFLTTALLPLAEGIIRFFDEHYPRDRSGKIRFEPAAALETWHEAVNPLPEIAGLRFVLDGLARLPAESVSEAQRAAWRRLREMLPGLPTRTADGETILAAAEQLIGEKRNSENVELYAVFPYPLYGVGKPDLDMARLTFEKRLEKGSFGWRQDDVQAAFLGLAAVAREYVAQRFATKHPGSRFPAFWGPNMDWIPDQDHGGNGLMALQTMLLQADGGRILLFPAWPKEWDVEFRLHAPQNTLVEGVYRSGALESLKVTPPERAKDVVRCEPQ